MTTRNIFTDIMVNKTDKELQEYLDNRSQFQEDAVKAAIIELEKRGRKDEKVIEIENKIEKENQTEIETEEFETISKQKAYYTDDPNAPKLYPKWSIWLFSILFTTLAAGILMAMNFKQTGQKKERALTIGFSILYTILTIVIIQLMQNISDSNYNWTYLLNAFGAVVLDQYFWNIRLGKEIKYRKRSVFVPFVIWAAITALFVWNMLRAGQF